MDWCDLEEKSSFKMLGLNFSSKLDWGSYMSLLLELPPRKLGPCLFYEVVRSPEVALYLYKSTICSCMEYCYLELIVRIGVSLLLFLAKPPLNLQTVQVPFLGNPPPLYWFFVNSPPKSWICQ